jgi:methionine-rich copper-binding protein CopC
VSPSMRRTGLGMAFLVLSLHGALAAPKRMVESFPAAQAVVDGRNAQYSVRFDGLVDHRASRLLITQGSRVVETLKPLLSAAPEVLFASAPLLPPGDYELHWSARSMADDGVTEGSIPFTVRR